MDLQILHIRRMMLMLLQDHEQDVEIPGPVSNTSERIVVPVLNYIEAHYNETSIKELSDMFGYSESHLSRMISEYTGKSFTALISERQMDEGLHLLLETDWSVSSIAQEIGCFDASHFSHKFKKIYGMTPTRYRVQKRMTI